MLSISIDEVRKLFSYDPVTGVVAWRDKPNKHGYAGSEKKGYRYALYKGKMIQHHLIAFVLSYGRMPNTHVDHINAVRNDNRLVNLRECTPSQNNAARRKPLGVSGFIWCSEEG